MYLFHIIEFYSLDLLTVPVSMLFIFFTKIHDFMEEVQYREHVRRSGFSVGIRVSIAVCGI